MMWINGETHKSFDDEYKDKAQTTRFSPRSPLNNLSVIEFKTSDLDETLKGRDEKKKIFGKQRFQLIFN